MNNDKKIYRLILQKIKDPYLTHYIISLKIIIERNEILKYHIEQYNYIIKPYINYKYQENRNFSLIFNHNQYHIESDIDYSFFKKTNISHQVIELIQELICIKNKEERICEDILYSILANEICKNMKFVKI